MRPQARDEEIQRRLERILKATGWFEDASIAVNEGVVFISGRTEVDQYKKWASELAQSTQDVVAVVNRVEVGRPKHTWNFDPALASLDEMWFGLVHSLPFVVLSLIIILAALGAAKGAVRVGRLLLRRRLPAGLLREVTARMLGLLVFLVGIYITLHVSGLTNIALTVVGGTGLVGLVVGIAFRGITENFLASVFLSLQHPFQIGDLIEVGGILGYVHQLTTRTTILTTLDGNQVQVPNATVYTSTIHNYSSNPKRREDFVITVPYAVSLADAQARALQVLEKHPAILREPEPWVLVDGFVEKGVNLRVYFWLNGSRFSWLKIRSSVMRLVKRSLELAGSDQTPPDGRDRARGGPTRQVEPNIVATAAEGRLRTEAGQIAEQARESRAPEEGENLLDRSLSDPQEDGATRTEESKSLAG
ncbi:MAG: mechanosensitive ion channel family protein [Planctomycetia bacterium]|nr:mechanosensitive ion channel family protein [Planctomycetia bacterium]